LYEKFGFEEVLEQGIYERADIKMKKLFHDYYYFLIPISIHKSLFFKLLRITKSSH
jgi:hypothetical protein